MVNWAVSQQCEWSIYSIAMGSIIPEFLVDFSTIVGASVTKIKALNRPLDQSLNGILNQSNNKPTK